MGIVHGEAGSLPDFLEYFSTGFSSAPVKMEILGKKDIETTTMANFYSQVSGCARPGGRGQPTGNERSLINPVWICGHRRQDDELSCLIETVQLCYAIPENGDFSNEKLLQQ